MRQSDFDRAKSLVAGWPYPLIYHGTEFFELREPEGWGLCTPTLIRACNRAAGRHAEKSLLPLIAAHTALPPVQGNSRASAYWACQGSTWEADWEPFELQSHEVFCADGIYDLRAHTLRELPTHTVFGPRCTLMLHPYDDALPPATAEWEQAVTRALPDPDIRRHLQELAGAVLQPHVPLRGQIIFKGPPHTGKTTIATAIGCAPAGALGISTAQESEIVRDKWASIMLFGKFANVSDDSSRSPSWVSWMKRYTSGRMTIEAKWHRPVTVVPTAKLISTCNEHQSLQDPSGAAGQRLHVFHFDQIIPADQTPDQGRHMSVQHWSEPRRQRAVFDWLLQGLERLTERGCYAPPAQMGIARGLAETEADPIREVLLHNLSEEEGAFAPFTEIRALLPASMSPAQIARYICALFPRSRAIRQYVEGVQRRGWEGLKVH